MSGYDDTYKEVFDLLSNGADTLSWDAMWEAILQLQGSRARGKALREDVLALTGSDEVNLATFTSMLHTLAENHNFGSPQTVVRQLETHLLQEVFTSRQAKDGRLLKTELKKYLEQLHQRAASPKPKIDDFDRLMQIADFESAKYLNRDDFTWFITEVLRDERKDITISDLITGSRLMGSAGTFEQLKEKTRQSLAMFVPRSKGSPTTTKDEPPSPTFSSPRSTFARGWGKKVKDKLATGSFSPSSFNPTSVFRSSSEMGSGGAPSNVLAESLGSNPHHCESCAHKSEEIKQMKITVDELESKLDLVVADLHDVGASAEITLSKLARAEQKIEDLQEENAGRSREVEHLQRNAQLSMSDMEKRSAEEGRLVEERLRKQIVEKKKLEQLFAKEKEKHAELTKLRKHEIEVDTKRRADFAKIRHEKDEQIADLRKMIETLEVDKRLLEAETRIKEENMLSHRPHSKMMKKISKFSDASFKSVTSVTDSEATDLNAPSNVVFLPSQIQTQSRGDNTANATLFNDQDGPILHRFETRIFPSDLQFDVNLTAPVVKEHITLRDYGGCRSVCLELSGWDLIVPCTTLSTRLKQGGWCHVGVVFDWEQMLYTVLVDDNVVFCDIPFREETSRGLSVFDIYPRSSPVVAYANIRFANPEDAERRL